MEVSRVSREMALYACRAGRAVLGVRVGAGQEPLREIVGKQMTPPMNMHPLTK